MKPGPPRRGTSQGQRVDTATHGPGARGLLLPPLLLLLLAGRAAGVSDGPQESAQRVPRVSLRVPWSRAPLWVCPGLTGFSPRREACASGIRWGLLFPTPTPTQAACRALGTPQEEGVGR